MEQTKVFIVAGDNGMGNSGTCVFGLYPTRELADARLAAMAVLFEEGEDGCEYMYILETQVGPNGGDCSLYIEG
jgi:hypothetical protein